MIPRLYKKLVRKLNSAALKFFNVIKATYIPILPVHLDIEPINVCNFRCPHCKVSYWNKKQSVLEPDKLQMIISQFPALKSIKLQGLGEPMIHKKFLDLMRIGEQADLTISFTTNGSINNKEIFNFIGNNSKIFVYFSIDAADEKTFEKIRPGSNFNLIKQNIMSSSINSRNNSAFWTLMNHINVDEIPDIVRLAASLRISNVYFQSSINDWQNDSVRTSNTKNHFYPDSPQMQQKIIEAKVVAQEHGVKIVVYDGDKYSKKNKCKWAFTSAFISSNGDIVPCCHISDSDVIKMGNIFETPFKQVWNSKQYREFRRSIAKHELMDVCKSCYID